MAISVVTSGNCGLGWVSTVSNPTISISYQNGDYLVVAFMSNGAATSPTGFTVVQQNNSTGMQLFYYKFTSSGTSYQIPCNFSGSIVWMLIRGASVITASGSTNGGLFTPTFNPSVAGELIVSTTGNSDTGYWVPAGYTIIPSASWPSNEYYTLAYKAFNNTTSIPAHPLWSSANDGYIAFAGVTSLSSPTGVFKNTTTATLSDILNVVSPDSMTDSGFCYSRTNTNPTISDTKISLGAKPSGSYTLTTDITPITFDTYYVRAYGVKQDASVIYSPTLAYMHGGIVASFNPTNTGATGTIQSWLVPSTGIYRIEAYGAQGSDASINGYVGGKGAYMSGNFNLNAGDTLWVLVGQKGSPSISNNYGGNGGGGGTFVAKGATVATATPLLVAGGGGGAGGGYGYGANGYDAVLTNNGDGGNIDGTKQSNGGTNGGGGTGANYGGGGGGFTGNGANTSSNAEGGYSFINGGKGGSVQSWGGGVGGFGGGGCGGLTAGGGGGYSGGGASGTWSNTPPAGGGGSYNSGTSQKNIAGARTGAGLVNISVPTTTLTDILISNIAKTSIGVSSILDLQNGDTLTDCGFIWSSTNTTPTI